MVSVRILAITVVTLFGAALLAGESVGVSGSDTKYITPIDNKIGDKPVRLVLTGTALRKKYFFNVYTIGSYIQQGVTVSTPEELAAKDCPKQLHLILERDVGGKEMAEAFKTAIRKNYAAPLFEAELNQLLECMESMTVQKGDHVWLTHVPHVGFHCQVVGKTSVLIKNPGFSRAVWDIYLGSNNLGDAIKQGLVSRL